MAGTGAVVAAIATLVQVSSKCLDGKGRFDGYSVFRTAFSRGEEAVIASAAGDR